MNENKSIWSFVKKQSIVAVKMFFEPMKLPWFWITVILSALVATYVEMTK